jgi:polyphenol oxidase
MTHLPIITSHIFQRFDFIRCAVSTRRGGTSPEPFGMNLSFNVGDDPGAVRENRRIFLAAAGCDKSQIAQPRQCHSATVVPVARPGWYDASDALVTDRPGLCLGISVADCLPVFLVDPVCHAIGAVHAGWRGTAGHILSNAVRAMQDHFGTVPSNLAAFLGPSARACCYEVGTEVAAQFDKGLVEQRDGRLYLDLIRANVAQLSQAGVSGDNIEVSPLCTITERELLHSYRRDGPLSGRMLGVITMLLDNKK